MTRTLCVFQALPHFLHLLSNSSPFLCSANELSIVSCLSAASAIFLPNSKNSPRNRGAMWGQQFVARHKQFHELGLRIRLSRNKNCVCKSLWNSIYCWMFCVVCSYCAFIPSLVTLMVKLVFMRTWNLPLLEWIHFSSKWHLVYCCLAVCSKYFLYLKPFLLSNFASLEAAMEAWLGVSKFVFAATNRAFVPPCNICLLLLSVAAQTNFFFQSG